MWRSWSNNFKKANHTSMVIPPFGNKEEYSIYIFIKSSSNALLAAWLYFVSVMFLLCFIVLNKKRQYLMLFLLCCVA